MLLLLVEAYQSLLLLSDAGDVDGPGLFSSGIENAVGVAEVNECVSVKT